MWIEKSDNTISNAIEIDLDKAITQEELDAVANTTKRIKVTLDEENPEVENVDGVEYKTTIGNLKITPEDGYTYEYAIAEKMIMKKYQILLLCLKKLHKLQIILTLM